MRKLLMSAAALAFSIIVVCGEANAQYPASPNLVDEQGLRTGHWTILYDSNFYIVHDPDSMVFYRLIRFEAGKPVGKIRDFWKTGKKYWDGFARGIDPYIFHGESNHYHENGRLKYRQIYAEGKRHGPCADYYPNGVMQSEGQFEDDQQTGVWKYYHDNGKPRVQVTFVRDKKTGSATFYHPNGAISGSGSYKDNYYEGIWKDFNMEGRMTSFSTYRADTLHGVSEIYFENGALSERKHYERGLRQGDYISYHENGKVKSKGKYLDDEKEGYWVNYHANGTIRNHGMLQGGYNEGVWEFYYDNGQLNDKGMLRKSLYEGEWTTWYEDGNVRQKAEYKRDTLNGRVVSYYPNGKMESEGEKERGKMNGYWKKYTTEGVLRSEGVYFEDQELGTWKYYYSNGSPETIVDMRYGKFHGHAVNYYEDGTVMDDSWYKDGKRDSLYQAFHPNGAKSAVGYFKDDLKVGTWTWYHNNGVVSGTSSFIGGKENGPVRTYFEDGKPSVVAERRDDILIGKARFFYRGGRLSQEGPYDANGDFHGKWVVYDSLTGKPASISNFANGKRHGVSITYDSKGKVDSRRYYLHGFEETTSNVRDSIDHLIEIKDFANALRCVRWMEKVEKREFREPKDRLLSIHMNSRVYSAMKDYQKALEYDRKYSDAVGKYFGKQTNEYRVSVHNVAAALHGLDRYDEAFRYYDLAISIARPMGLVKEYWSSVNNKVYALYDAGRQEEAAFLFDEELRKSTAMYGPDSSAGWYLRHEVAEYYYSRVGDYEKSVTMFEELRDDMEAAGDTANQLLFNAYFKIGLMCYNYLDRNDKAVPAYQAAAQFAETNAQTDRPSYGTTLVDLFYMNKVRKFTDTTAVAESRALAAKLKRVSETSPDAETRAEAFLALGNEEYDLSRYGEAYRYFQLAAEAFDQAGMGNTLRKASVLQSLAFALYYSDRMKAGQSEQYFLKSMEIRKEKAKRTSPTFYASERQLAALYVLMEKYDEAIALLEDVIKIATEVEDRETVAKVHHSLGEIYFYRWQYTESIRHMKMAVDYYETVGIDDKQYWINGVGYLCSAYKFRGDYDEAVALGKDAINLAERFFGKGSSSYFFRVLALGSVYQRNDMFTDALREYNTAAQGLEAVFGYSSLEYIGVQRNIIEVYSEMLDYKKVIDLGEQQLTLVKNNYGENNDGWVELVHVVADAYAHLQQHDKAEAYFQSAIRNSGLINGPDSPTTALHMSRLGKFYKDRNRLEEAQAVLQQSVDMIRNSDYSKSSVISTYLSGLADVMLLQDKNKEAEELFTEAFASTLADTVNSITSYVEAGQELAKFYNKVGRYRDSERLLKKVTGLIDRVYGKSLYYARVREVLVFVYSRQRLYDEAEEEAKALISILEDEVGQDHWLMLSLHNYLGIIYDDRQKFDLSVKEFAHCVESLKLKKTLTEIEQSSLATYYSNQARIELCLGKYDDAYKHLQECDRIRKAIRETPTQVTAAAYQANMAAYYFATGKDEKAEATWAALNRSLLSFSQNNFYFMSDEEKAQFWKSINVYFGVFQSFAAQRAARNPAISAEMYNVQLATKAILLSASNKIRKRILSSGDTSMVNMYYRWTHQREQLAQLYSSGTQTPAQRKSIDSLELQARLLEKEMNITAEDLSTDRGGGSVTWKNVQLALGPDEAAVEIIRFRHYDRYMRDSVIYAALVLTSETRQYPKLVTLRNGNLLEGRYLKFYRNSILAKIQDTLSYREYWQPLEAALTGKTRIYLSLDGVYNQINLNTLMDAKGRFLVEDKNLTILSNTKDILAIKSRKLKRISLSSATLFGFPTYFIGKGRHELPSGTTRDFDAAADTDRTGISPLLGTQEEIQKVSSILQSHKMQANVFTSEMASERKIKQLQHPRVLHIATHGFFVEESGSSLGSALGADANPLLRAGLLLAGAANFIQNRARTDEENGILTAYEAANLDLDNTDLVVLSACETGKGEVQNGEGVYGLQRAFQAAGAQTIVMSLWKVDDAATQQLMTTFYSNWMNGMTKAAALKTAQVELKKTYPHPYYWGAFVMLEN